MPGVRLIHRERRSCMMQVENPLRAYPDPYNCGICGIKHLCKTYHLMLDEHGAVIVSPGVLENLRPVLDLVGFDIGNEVKNPPTIRIGF